MHYDILDFPSFNEFREAVEVAKRKDLRITEEVFTVKVRGPFENFDELWDARERNEGDEHSFDLQMLSIEPRYPYPRPREEKDYVLLFRDQASGRKVHCSYDFEDEHGLLTFYVDK